MRDRIVDVAGGITSVNFFIGCLPHRCTPSIVNTLPPKLKSLATLYHIHADLPTCRRGPWKPWTGTALGHFVVAVEGAAGRVSQRCSFRVVLWVGLSGQVFL